MSAPAWHPNPEDELWLIEEVAAHIAISNWSTSHRCWRPQSVWEPVLRGGLRLGVYVDYGHRELAWAGGLRMSERWPDGYTVETATTERALRSLVKEATLDAAWDRTRSKVEWQVNMGGGR